MVVTPLLIIFQLYPGRQFMVVTPLLIIFQLYPGPSVYGGYPTFNNISVYPTFISWRSVYGGYPTFNNISVISWTVSLYLFQLYSGRQFMVVTPLLIIFQLYPGKQFMVVTPLLIIFQLYPGRYGGYLTFNHIVISW